MLAQTLSTRLKLKQKTAADVPYTPLRPVSQRFAAVSSAGQTTIALGFSVDQGSKNNFFLWINGQLLVEGASNDYQWTNIQADNTSQTIVMNYALVANLSIAAAWLGILQPNVSISTLQAQTNTNSASLGRNALLNGAFDHWQRLLTTGSSTIGSIANGSSTYGPDRWYAKNSLGTNGVLQFDQTTGVLNGSIFGCSLKIATAPTVGQTNGCELYQVLENTNSYEFYNQAASFSAQIKALGNVNQVGVQFFYATSEVKLTTAIGSEILVAVNSSTFSLASIVGQAMGTAQTVNGVVGIRIRITGVSSGNTYDINNGFVVEQTMMTRTATVQSFARQNVNYGTELLALRRYFWRTGSSNPIGWGHFSTTTQVKAAILFPVKMRATPTPGFSNSSNGATFSRPGSSNSASSVLTFVSTTQEGTYLGDANDTGSPTTSASASTAGFPTIVTAGTYFQADAEI